jgi:mono/diheme cytochrome c family protein
MSRRRRWPLALALAAVLLAFVVALATRGIGFSARATPWTVEERVALAARSWAIPASARNRTNPVAATPEVVQEGLAHWADHCALCHSNDGSGTTGLGRSFYPPAPDMRAGRTQQLTDGELFYIIERGVPLTGMPAWSTGTADGEHASWVLVHFIRRLPELTAEDLRLRETLNPVRPVDAAREQRFDDFLRGGK